MGWHDWLRRFRKPAPRSQDKAAELEVTQDFPAVPALSLSAPEVGFQLKVGVVSDTGNVRERNEDNYYVPGLRPARREDPSGRGNGVAEGAAPAEEDLQGLFLVADGMGGQLAGEKASEMAVQLLPAQLRRRLVADEDEKSIRRAIRDAVSEANKEILAQSHLVPEFSNMGTTIVLALFRGDRAYIAGIGDSRAYRLRNGRMELLTTDHSLARALVDAGTIKPEEAENHKFRHVLYNYLGCKDARDGPDEIRVVDVRHGDRFLLASDGLTGVVRDQVIAEVLQACDDPQRAAQALANRALENRSKDNITCVVIQVT